MTDITDQDRRAARAWAKNWQGDQDGDTSAAARVILATVDAPEPVLSEVLRQVAEEYDVNGYPEPEQCFRTFADCAKQMEHDLAEARAEVERLTAVAEDYARMATAALTERDESRAERDQVRSELAEVTNARDSLREDYDHTRTEVELFTAHLAEAHAEVERLTAERNSNGRAAQLERDGDAPSQDVLNPADVKPGEAWLVEVNGKRGTALKDGGGLAPWSVVINGVFTSRCDEFITLVARLVPDPRTVRYEPKEK